MKHVFVVGDRDCPIPVLDRRDPCVSPPSLCALPTPLLSSPPSFDCQPHSLETPRFDVPLAAVAITKTAPGHQRVSPPPLVGLEVVVDSWTTITHLAVFDSGADGFTSGERGGVLGLEPQRKKLAHAPFAEVRVRLWNRGSDKASLLEAVFSATQPGTLRNGFRYIEVPQVTLPRGFAAVITVEGGGRGAYLSRLFELHLAVQGCRPRTTFCGSQRQCTTMMVGECCALVPICAMHSWLIRCPKCTFRARR